MRRLRRWIRRRRTFQIPISTGTKIGTARTEKVGFWGATPIPVPGSGLAGPWMFLDVLRFFAQAGLFRDPDPS